MTKRILSLILTIAMVLSCVPFQVFAESIPTEVTEAAAEEMPLPEATEPEATEAVKETTSTKKSSTRCPFAISS